MSILCACFYVPVQQMWWLGDAVGQDDFAVDKPNGPTWNLVGAKEFTRRVVKDWVVLKGKGESASVNLGKSVCVHELKESRTRIGAKDVDFLAGTLIEPGLRARQRGWRDRKECVTWRYLKKTGRRTLIQLQMVGKKAGALTMAIW